MELIERQAKEPNVTEPEVTQEDRDLVVAFYSRSHATFWPDNFSKAMETCDEIKRGHCDNWELVQAVASHRQQAAKAERDRIVAWLRDDARLTEIEARRILGNLITLTQSDTEDWAKLIAMKHGIAAALESQP